MNADEGRFSILFYLCSSVFICGFISSIAAANDSPFGINGCSWSHLGMNTEKFDREAGLKRLKAIKEAGIKWDRCDFWWGRIEPEKGKFVWRDVDWVVEQYAKHDVQLMPILCYGSAWQKSDAPVTDEERALFARFVYETVNRYKKHVHVWEIWNEPNITPFWSPNPDVNEYAKLLKVAYAAAKRADPKCTVVGAATAGTDMAFIEGLLLAGGGEHMDVVSIHPYQGDLGSLSPDKGGLADQIRGVQKLLAEHGYRKPIWLTEIGHRTTGTHGHTHVTEEQQAAYLVRTYAIALASGADRVFWFNLQDWEEYWGIIRQSFERKPSFEAYRAMAKQLDGKRVIGTLGDGAVVFARGAPGSRVEDPVVVSWSPQDDDSVPTFAEKLPRDAQIEPLPEPPAPVKQKRASVRPPAIPRNVPWWVGTTKRFIVSVAVAEPPTHGTTLTVPADRVPKEFDDVREFTVMEYSAGHAMGIYPAERDLDGNVVFLIWPRSEATTRPTEFLQRNFALHPGPDESHKRRLNADDASIGNDRITIEFDRQRLAKSIRLRNGYEHGADELGGLFTASYKDTRGQWPRTDAGARLVSHEHVAGRVLAQYRSRVAFGANDCEYEFTVTLFDEDERISYTGRWMSPGSGATQQVNLGDSFPAGTVVTGMYGKATLPSAGVGYGPACVIRPSDHATVTAVMVSPSGRLNTPGWATRSVVGAGLFYQTSFPATVSADYFWYEHLLKGDLSHVARDHHFHCAFPPAIAVGPFETRH